MNGQIIQIVVLAGIAIFLFLRLRDILGTREGFEPERKEKLTKGEVIDMPANDEDPDIAEHFELGSDDATALQNMKRAEPDFSVTDFISGARGAYEMILIAFENGDIDEIQPFLGEDVLDAFSAVVDERKKNGLSVEANFIGLRETRLIAARFDVAEQLAEVDVRFMAELTSIVRNADGQVIEGSESEVKKQRDTWTFARNMGTDDPNWLLVTTGD